MPLSDLPAKIIEALREVRKAQDAYRAADEVLKDAVSARAKAELDKDTAHTALQDARRKVSLLENSFLDAKE
jgi:hypothetical protein